MFSSSQIGLEQEESEKARTCENKNIVLFSHICGLEPYCVPDGTAVEVFCRHGNPDDPDRSIVIQERMPDAQGSSSTKRSVAPFGMEDFVHSSATSKIPANMGLRLDIKNVEVWKVEGVNYKTSPRPVYRYCD